MFTIFCIVAAWMLPLPLWLQIVLTVVGILHVLSDVSKEVND